MHADLVLCCKIAQMQTAEVSGHVVLTVQAVPSTTSTSIRYHDGRYTQKQGCLQFSLAAFPLRLSDRQQLALYSLSRRNADAWHEAQLVVACATDKTKMSSALYTAKHSKCNHCSMV